MLSIEKFEDIQRWASFKNADAFLTFHYTDSGMVILSCGKEVSVPGDFTEDCASCKTRDHWYEQHNESLEGWHGDISDCTCQQTGWIGEFQAWAVGGEAEVDIDTGDHVWVFGTTFDVCVDNLHAAILAKHICGCRHVSKDHVAQAKHALEEIEEGTAELIPFDQFMKDLEGKHASDAGGGSAGGKT